MDKNEINAMLKELRCSQDYAARRRSEEFAVLLANIESNSELEAAKIIRVKKVKIKNAQMPLPDKKMPMIAVKLGLHTEAFAAVRV